jgi:hypothetical protein
MEQLKRQAQVAPESRQIKDTQSDRILAYLEQVLKR